MSKSLEQTIPASLGQKAFLSVGGLWVIASFLSLIWQSPEFQLSKTLAGPSLDHLWGNDPFGRDVLLLTLRSCAVSFGFGLTATALAIIFGFFGAVILESQIFGVSHFFRVTFQIMLAFPSLLFAIGWSTLFGPGWNTLFFSLCIGHLPGLARLFSAKLSEVLKQEYVLASRAIGTSYFSISRWHAIPALMSLARVKAPQIFASAILAEATLSFLGLGAPIGDDTLGSLLIVGRAYMIEAPHLLLAAGVPLIYTVLCVLWLSDYTREQ